MFPAWKKNIVCSIECRNWIKYLTSNNKCLELILGALKLEPNVGRKIAKQEMPIFPQETSMPQLKEKKPMKFLMYIKMHTSVLIPESWSAEILLCKN